MRVLIITGSFPPMRCGVGDYTHQLAISLSQYPELRIGVLTSKTAASRSTQQHFELFPVVESWQVRELAAIRKVVSAWSPDVVHIQYPTLGYGQGALPWLLPMYLYVAGIPVVQTWHEIYSLKQLLRARRLLLFVAKALVPGILVVVREGFEQSTHAPLRWAFLTKAVRLVPNASAVPTVSLGASEREEIRLKYARPNCRMIVFFGFIYPRKRVELLFQIADPEDSHITIIGDSFREEDLKNHSLSAVEASTAYLRSIRQIAETEPWRGNVLLTGFLPDEQAARILATADAVVLPFLDGGGWNTSLHAAQAQGTFVLTTSAVRRGYDQSMNTYFAGECDINDMRRALRQYSGERHSGGIDRTHTWSSIAQSHVALYQTQVRTRKGS